MSRIQCPGLDGSNPLHFLASLGALRILSRGESATRMGWMQHQSIWVPLYERKTESWSLSDAAAEIQSWLSVLGKTGSTDSSLQRRVRELSTRIKQLREARKEKSASLSAELKKQMPPKDVKVTIAQRLAPDDEEISQLQTQLAELQSMLGDTLGDGVAHLGDIIGIGPEMFREKSRRAAMGWTTRRLKNTEPSTGDIDLVIASLASLGCDRISESGKVVNTPFSFANGSSGQCLLKDFRDAASKATVDSTFGTLVGVPVYLQTLSALGWDPADQGSYALQWQAPEITNKKGNKKVDPSLQTLAYLGLSLLPAIPHNGRLSAQAWLDSLGKKGFCWPIWSSPLGLDAIFSLLGSPFRSGKLFPGIEAMQVSWTQNPNGKRIFFAPSRSL